MADKSYKLTLSLSDGSTINAGTITAPQGPNGANGATFTPSVSAAGVLSWTNNGGLTNPSPISIKGPKGDDAVITESDVKGWGFTKNEGTITEIKMNGVSKGKSGVVDLGTVLTAHTGLVGGNLVQYDSSAQTLKDSGKKISDLATASQVNAMLEDKQDKITSSNKLSSSLIDGLGAAAAKAVDTAISANSTSTNLPTSKAVEDRINAHSGIDKVGTVTGVKMNGTTKNPSSGVVDIGTVITDVSDKQDKITSSNKLDASLVSGLSAVATSGSYNDLSNKLTAGSNISISGNTISATVPTNYVTTDTEQTITSKKTFNGEVKFGSTENFQGYYIKRMLGFLSAGTRYENLDSLYKDGTYHRMWRLRFPSGSNFWGKIKITLYGNYSSFNASGVMSKSVTCNFNTSSIYNNVGCYDGLGVNVEQDFRISEAIWNATVNAWEVLIWQKNLKGNNSPEIMLECWTTNNTKYIKAFNGIAAQTVELTQSTSYSAQKASPTGGTKTVEWATLPVYENPLGEEIATMSDLSNKANLADGNTFDSQQIFEDITGTTTINGSYVTIKPTGTQGAYSFEALNSNNTTAFSINGDSSGRIKVGSPVELGNGFGTSGQVLTSQGAGETPTWTTPAIKSVSLSGTTLTITL